MDRYDPYTDKFLRDTQYNIHGTNLAEVGTDCISRDDVLRIVDYYGQWNDYHGREREAIEQLPPIQPKRGRWIKLDMHRGMADHKCTACGQECYVPTCMGEPLYAFCPNCGSYNGGEQDDKCRQV